MKVSVLLTSYKHERYLRACLDSALSQTFEDYEVIVVDDNSPDSSPQILKSYGGRIRLVMNEQNRGTYAVLNQALEMAKGEYAAVLNSDDLWKPEKLARQVELMDSDPDLTFCHTYGDFIDGEGNVIDGAPMGFSFPRTETGDVFPTFIANNTAIAASVMMRTSVAREAGGFDATFRNLGDWDMWLRFADRGPVGFVDEKLTLYRVHSMNTIYDWGTTQEEEARIREQIMARKGELLARYGNSAEIKNALAHCASCLGSLRSISGRPAEARRLYAESLRLNPKRFKSVLRYLLTFAPLGVRRRTL